MSSYQHRLDRIERDISPQHQPQVCIVFGDADVDATVARFRAARDWPDDGAHPVQVMHVRWGTAQGAWQCLTMDANGRDRPRARSPHKKADAH